MGKFDFAISLLKFQKQGEGLPQFIEHIKSIPKKEKNQQFGAAIAVLELAEKVDKEMASSITLMGEKYYTSKYETRDSDWEKIRAFRALIEAIPEEGDHG